MTTIPEALALGIENHQAGRLQAAEQIYRQILAVEPNQAEALHLLGVIAHQLGNHAMAVEHIGRALALKGDAADFHNNLGVALYAQGELDQAVACYRRALALTPDYADALGNLANALRDQGKLAEAAACYRRALELKPSGEVFHDLGLILLSLGEPAQAAHSFREAVRLMPSAGPAFNNLGIALVRLGQLSEAASAFEQSLRLQPNDSQVAYNLGLTHHKRDELDKAVAYYRQALRLHPGHVDACNNLATVLEVQGKLDEAIAWHRQTLELKPTDAATHSKLGRALEEKGDLRAAEDSFRAALRHDSRFVLAHYKLAGLLGGKLPEADLAAQRRLLEDTALPDAQRLLLHFGLAQVLDARGAYAEAADHLERGNALQQSEWRKCGQVYDPKRHQSFMTQMIRVCTPAFFERLRGFGSESKLPVFVFGMPRSGTTLIEQILASHSRIHGAGELRLGGQSFEAIPAVLGRSEAPVDCIAHLDAPGLRWLAKRHEEQLQALADGRAERVVDKMPDNYMYLGFLAALFPQAVFVHCRRDPRDVAVSCWLTHFQEVLWAGDQQHIASRINEYQRAMEHWRKVLPVSMLEVDYEETVADLEGVARKLVAWCGLAWEPTCLDFYQAKRSVRTCSVVQVRQPLFGTSVGRWQHYEHLLLSLFSRLETLVPFRTYGV